jgi:hypothetical protein
LKETQAPPAPSLTHQNLSENDRLCANARKRHRQEQSSKFRTAAKSLGLDQILSMEESFEGMMPIERFLAEMRVSKERRVK